MTNSYTLLPGQTAMDAAMQLFGKPEGLLALALANPDAQLLAAPAAAGTELAYDTATEANAAVVAFYRLKQITPATA